MNLARTGSPTRWALELRAEDGRGARHGTHLSLGARPREVLHPAVGGDDDPVRRRIRESSANAIGDQFDGLDLVVGQVDDAQDDGLLAEVVQDTEIQTRLCGLDRDLVGRATGQLRKERVPLGPVVDDRGVPEADVDGGGAGDAVERGVERGEAVLAGASGRACMYGSSIWTRSAPAACRSLISALTAAAYARAADARSG